MNWRRIRYSAGLLLRQSGQKRAEYLKRQDVFFHMGSNCMMMLRKVPLYPKLISIGDNVWVASNVLLVTHDVIHRMLNNAEHKIVYQEYLGCIEIQDNVFIGSNTTILPNVRIGSNTIIAAGSVVSKSISGNGVYGGVPAKYMSSLEEFSERRKQIPRIEIKRTKQSLADKTIVAVWNRYKQMQSEENRV